MVDWRLDVPELDGVSEVGVAEVEAGALEVDGSAAGAAPLVLAAGAS